jgi:iron complex outermembrane recepter protein
VQAANYAACASCIVFKEKFMNPIFVRTALASALACAWSLASAQTSPAAAPATPAAPAAATAPSAPTLKEVTITANPLGSNELIAPAASYSGQALLLRSQSTLGETLSNTPGVSSTYFGPNASRPMIRGLDGDRVRVLQNSGASIDASGLSYDHAVPLDPIAIERIEVLRGPGALMYGGSAVGGVVNVIDNRIPREAVEGVAGKVDFGLSSGNDGKNGAFMVEGGNKRFTLHADAFSRSSGDVSAPITLACTKPGTPSLARKICNSAADSKGAALGGSVFFDAGYLGAALSTFKTNYGTVAEDEVTIGMRSNRFALEGEVKVGGWLQSVKGQYSRTDYQHTEFEGANAGTVFKNKGNDLRLEARHTKLGPLEGVIGLQTETNNFSAAGEEAFAPYSQTKQSALFIYEEASFSWGKLSLGGRVESVKVQSFGNPDLARFVPYSRSFKPASFALGGLLNLNPQWQLTGNFASTQRAPKDYELFADGPHIATAAYEVGNAAMEREKSTNIDVGLKWKSGAHTLQVNAFASRFKNYILLNTTGNSRGQDGELNPEDLDGDGVAAVSGAKILPEYAYSQVPARFRGLEASGNLRLLDSAHKVDLQWRADSVRAINSTTGSSLPRIAPVRLGATVVWGQGPVSVRTGFDHYAKPRDNTALAYMLWNAAVTYAMKAQNANLLWYARLDNASNKLAYSATSVLTQSAPGKSPLPGRGLKVGLQATF